MMRTRHIRTVMRKDFLELLRNKKALAPLVVVPLLLVAVLPTLFILVGGSGPVAKSINGISQFLENLPTGTTPAGLSEQAQAVYAIVIFFFAPIYLLVPVMVANVTASSSFVGEKERRTLEGLFYTPVSDSELVTAKILVSFLPAMGVSWVAFVIYGVVVNGLGYHLFGELVFPTVTWLITAFVIAPLISIFAIELVVAMSQRASTMQSAQGLSVIVVLPVVGLVVSQASGAVMFNSGVALIIAAVLVVIDAVLFRVMVHRFHRERMLVTL